MPERSWPNRDVLYKCVSRHPQIYWNLHGGGMICIRMLTCKHKCRSRLYKWTVLTNCNELWPTLFTCIYILINKLLNWIINTLLAILPGLLLHFVLVSTSAVRHNSYKLVTKIRALSKSHQPHPKAKAGTAFLCYLWSFIAKWEKWFERRMCWGRLSALTFHTVF